MRIGWKEARRLTECGWVTRDLSTQQELCPWYQRTEPRYLSTLGQVSGTSTVLNRLTNQIWEERTQAETLFWEESEEIEKRGQLWGCCNLSWLGHSDPKPGEQKGAWRQNGGVICAIIPRSTLLKEQESYEEHHYSPSFSFGLTQELGFMPELNWRGGNA